MNFSIKKLIVQENESYKSLAKKMILEDDHFQKYKDSQEFVKSVSYGIQKYLDNKKLVPDQTVKLVDNVEFYLNSVSTSTVGVIKNKDQGNAKKGTVNQIKKVNDPLLINIHEYHDYKDYEWKEYENGYEEKHGEIGNGASGINGDKSNANEVKTGFLYVFEHNKDLKYSFVIKDKKYQEVKLSKSDCSYTYRIGTAKNYARITNFFEEYSSKWYQFVFSKVKLSKERLFGDETTSSFPLFVPNHFCREFRIAKYALRDLNHDERKGFEILADYRKTDNGIDQKYYCLRNESFKNAGSGVSIFYPDPIKELERRAKIYQERFEAREQWLNEENRVQQRFLHNTISAMIEKDSSLKRYANKERLREWKSQYDYEYKFYNHKVHYGAENLIAWLESKELQQYLFNHLASTDKKDWVTAVDAYQDAITYLDQFWMGLNFFEEQIKDPKSFISIALSLHHNGRAKDDTFNKLISLRDAYFNQDVTSAAAAAGRKAEQAVLGLAQKSAPVIMKILGSKAGVKMMRAIARGALNDTLIDRKIIQPLVRSIQKVEVLDIDTLARKHKNKANVGKVISCIEAINVFFAIKTLMDDPKNRNRNIANVLGASIDFTTENWLFKGVIDNKLVKVAPKLGTKVIPGMQLISGCIDCYVGLDSAWDAHKSGEIGLRNGYLTFAVGGAITAWGAGLIVAGGTTATASVGSLSVSAGVLVVAGCIVEAVGLGITFFYDNKKVKDWIDYSIFGDEAEILETDIFGKLKDKPEKQIIQGYRLGNVLNNEIKTEEVLESINRTCQNQIEGINRIMCDFTWDASFDQGDIEGVSYTRVVFEIEPGIITENAIISFANVKAYSENRISEYFSWGDEDHTRKERIHTGKSIELQLEKYHNFTPYVEKDHNGMIRKIKIRMDYHEDIDKVTGDITVDFNNGTLQALTKSFDEEAAFYE